MKRVRRDALTVEEAERHFEPLKRAGGVLLAVSGGPDSVALMHLLVAAGGRTPLPPVTVATVDHGLQAGSATLSGTVAAQAEALGLPAHVLVWEGPKPTAQIQERAREARYGLLVRLSRRIGATHLVTAHTLDDQAETILLRMTRGSGLSGLAGMQPAVARESVLHVRPFLDVPKQRLVEACRANGWSFVEDPANRDPRFARSRLRKMLPLLATEGLDASALATLGRRAARATAAIGEKARLAVDQSRLPAGTDRQAFDFSRLLEEPAEVLLRALELSLTDFAREGPPRLRRLETLVDDLQKAFCRGDRFKRTLHGAIVSWRAGSALELVKEVRRVSSGARLEG